MKSKKRHKVENLSITDMFKAIGAVPAGGNMNDATYLAFQLAMGDQFRDLQKNGRTYVKKTKDGDITIGDIYAKAYHNVLELISKLQKNPDEKLFPYEGNWYTKEEIDHMFYNDIC